MRSFCEGNVDADVADLVSEAEKVSGLVGLKGVELLYPLSFELPNLSRGFFTDGILLSILLFFCFGIGFPC